MLRAAFGALFAALAPIGFATAGLGDDAAVRCGAVVLFAVVLAFGRSAQRTLRRMREISPAVFSERVAQVIRGVGMIVIAAQVAAASGTTGRAAAGLVFFGQVALLGYCAFAFVRLIFIRPVEDE
jgi:hypothetical protein